MRDSVNALCGKKRVIPKNIEGDSEQDLTSTRNYLEHDQELKCAQLNDSEEKGCKATAKIVRKYVQRQGKQIFVRFPTKLPITENEFQQKAMSLSNLIVKASKPRQKHARFCLIDFKSTEDRDTALKDIRRSIKRDENFKGIFVSIPRTESQEFVQELINKKLKSLEKKKSKLRLKRDCKRALRSRNFTSSIIVLNFPRNISTLEIKRLFPNAVDIQLKPLKKEAKDCCVATITLQSTKDARAAVQKPVFLEGKQLLIRFNTKSSQNEQLISSK